MMNRRRKKEIKSLVKKITISLLIAVPLALIIKNAYVCYYVNPNTNTSVFSHLANTNQNLNTVLKKITTSKNKINTNSKVIYTQGIGNTYLKNNNQNTEYNYIVGINLGKYIYNGTNEQDIANAVYQSIYEIKTQVPQELEDTGFFELKSNKRHTTGKDVEVLTTSIRYVIAGNPYTLKMGGIGYKLKNKEVLLYKYEPIVLLNKGILYNKNTQPILQKITVYEDYYFDIVNLKNKKTIRVNIVPKNIKFPNKNLITGTYTGFESITKANDKIKEEHFFDDIIKTYATLYVNPSYLTVTTSTHNPIEIIKRIMQSGYLLEKIIPRYIVSEMKNNTKKILENESIKLFNDYYSAIDLVTEIAQSKNTYDQLKTNGELKNLIKGMEQILMTAINDPSITLDELKPLFTIQKQLIENQDALANLNYITENLGKTTKAYIHKLIINRIPEIDKYIIYSVYMDKILESAGIYHIKANIDNGIKVLNNGFLNGIQESEYENIKTYNLANIMTANVTLYGGINATNDYWVSYNPTEIQKIALDSIKKHLSDAKSNYKLRFRFGFKK